MPSFTAIMAFFGIMLVGSGIFVLLLGSASVNSSKYSGEPDATLFKMGLLFVAIGIFLISPHVVFLTIVMGAGLIWMGKQIFKAFVRVYPNAITRAQAFLRD